MSQEVLVDLIKNVVITIKYGKVIVTFCIGTAALYELQMTNFNKILDKNATYELNKFEMMNLFGNRYLPSAY